MKNKELIDAVRNRNLGMVEALITKGYPLEERDHRGSTALRIAAGSEQYVIAEKLVEAGADIYTMDSLHITAAGAIYKSNLIAGNPDGNARQRLLELMRELEVPEPVPSRKEMPLALKNGGWPAHATPPPLNYGAHNLLPIKLLILNRILAYHPRRNDKCIQNQLLRLATH